MKKSGIINPELCEALASLGHFDSFVICDMGFPIPAGAKRIDLTLVAGCPRFLPVLKACLREVVVQEMVMMDGIAEANKPLHQEILGMVHNQELRYLSLPDFRSQARDAKFYIRTGETAPCSNICLVSASGVQTRVEQYDIPICDLGLATMGDQT